MQSVGFLNFQQMRHHDFNKSIEMHYEYPALAVDRHTWIHQDFFIFNIKKIHFFRTIFIFLNKK